MDSINLSGLLKRHFTKDRIDDGKTVYDLFEWKKVDVKLHDRESGKVIFDLPDLDFPKHYSQSACDIIASKYFRKKGVGGIRDCEYSLKQLVNRMVDFWVDALVCEKVITEDKKAIVYDELAYTLLAQMWAPNSPQWFNTGLKKSYNIVGNETGHYYFDEKEKTIKTSMDAYSRTQGSACFIISVKDSLLGEKSLSDQITTETLLFKYGSGVGTNWSSIRAKDEMLSGGGKSSGLMSFLKVSDRNAGAIKSGGTTRRAAKMNILDPDHPEIIEYIRWKAQEEGKVAALGKMGYSTSFEGEAYETVSGQNANNSVRLPDSFMNKIHDQNAFWQLKGRVDKNTDKEISVAHLWDELAQAAWRCGDPGVQFDDTINAWHTCPNGEDGLLSEKHNRINASNPCSEYMFLDDTSCNLASINITKFYNCETDEFNIESYLHTIMLVQLVLEATIYNGQFPTKDIARKTYNFRATGIGFTDLGSMLMLMAKPYDSNEARNVAAAVTSLMTGYSYYISALMAKEVTPFICYSLNAEQMKKVIRNHARAAGVTFLSGDFEELSYIPLSINNEILISMGKGFSNLVDSLNRVWQMAIVAGEAYGYRNAQVSVLAPTGTISFSMDCATTSSEPFFSHVAYKKMAGGGYIEIVNPALEKSLKKLGYTQSQIQEIIGYVMQRENNVIKDGKIEGAPYLKEEHLPIFDTANCCGTGKRFIHADGHVKMMGALAPHVSGAISKTVNIPNNATIADVKKIYEDAWRLGVKAIALYRDGCKASQPLNSSKRDAGEKPLNKRSYQELIDYINKSESLTKPKRVKPKGIRNAHVHEAQINGLKLYITTSFYEDGRLGEIYVSSGRQGSLVKGLLDSLSTTISEMLQYGVPPYDIAKMYRGQKYEPSGFVAGHPYIKSVDSISDLISKIIDIELGDYSNCNVTPEGIINQEPNKQFSYIDTFHGELCSTCKSEKLVKNGTCKVCMECGTTTGCS